MVDFGFHTSINNKGTPNESALYIQDPKGNRIDPIRRDYRQVSRLLRRRKTGQLSFARISSQRFSRWFFGLAANGYRPFDARNPGRTQRLAAGNVIAQRDCKTIADVPSAHQIKRQTHDLFPDVKTDADFKMVIVDVQSSAPRCVSIARRRSARAWVCFRGHPAVFVTLAKLSDFHIRGLTRRNVTHLAVGIKLTRQANQVKWMFVTRDFSKVPPVAFDSIGHAVSFGNKISGWGSTGYGRR